MTLQGAAEKPDGFSTKLYNNVLVCNVTVVTNEELNTCHFIFS
jgi:hypothetical protein